jgi:hypothetical protein
MVAADFSDYFRSFHRIAGEGTRSSDGSNRLAALSGMCYKDRRMNRPFSFFAVCTAVLFSSGVHLLAAASAAANSVHSITVEHLAALKAISGETLSLNDHADVLGYQQAGDLGGGSFIFKPGSAVDDDGGLVIAPRDKKGRWHRLAEARVNVRWFGAKADGVSDDTRALQSAIDSLGHSSYRGSLYIPAGAYRITASLTLGKGGVGLSKPVHIQGDGQASQIINTAPPGNPTFAFRGVSFWSIRDLLLTGTSSNRNDGVLVAKDAAGNQCARFVLENIITEMAGRGFVLENANTGVLRNCKHWSSSNANGATVRPAVAPTDISHGIHLTGEFCNDISIYDFDCIVSGGWQSNACAIFCDAQNANAIRIFGGTIEGSHQGPNQYGIHFNNVQPFLIEGAFAENSKFRFNNCRSGVITAVNKAGDGGTWFTGRSIRCTMIGSADDSLHIDAECERITVINCDFDRKTSAIVNEGINCTFIGVSDQGALLPDIIGISKAQH